MTRQETKEMFSVGNDELSKLISDAQGHAFRAEAEYIEFGNPTSDLEKAEAKLIRALELVRKMKEAL